MEQPKSKFCQFCATEVPVELGQTIKVKFGRFGTPEPLFVCLNCFNTDRVRQLRKLEVSYADQRLMEATNQ